jgi:D-lyxose ketol-isomerase
MEVVAIKNSPCQASEKLQVKRKAAIDFALEVDIRDYGRSVLHKAGLQLSVSEYVRSTDLFHSEIAEEFLADESLHLAGRVTDYGAGRSK